MDVIHIFPYSVFTHYRNLGMFQMSKHFWEAITGSHMYWSVPSHVTLAGINKNPLINQKKFYYISSTHRICLGLQMKYPFSANQILSTHRPFVLTFQSNRSRDASRSFSASSLWSGSTERYSWWQIAAVKHPEVAV